MHRLKLAASQLNSVSKVHGSQDLRENPEAELTGKAVNGANVSDHKRRSSATPCIATFSRADAHEQLSVVVTIWSVITAASSVLLRRSQPLNPAPEFSSGRLQIQGYFCCPGKDESEMIRSPAAYPAEWPFRTAQRKER